MTGNEPIRTPRLMLRRLTQADAPALHAIMSDTDAMAFWSTLPHISLAQTEEWLAGAIAAVDGGESDDFAVIHDCVLVGKAGLWKGNELGMLFAKSVWRTGIAREAVEAVIDRARLRGVKSIVADVDPRNVRAVTFLRRLGFVMTGEAKRTYKIGNLWTDSVYLELQLRERAMSRLPDNPPQPTVLLPGAGDTNQVGPSRTTIKLGAGDTKGIFGMVEYEVAPCFVAPAIWHWHTKEGWAAYVLDGILSVGFLDRTVELPKGGVIAVPPRCPFVWSNPSDTPARILFLYGPAGFENYFREVGAVLAANPGKAPKDLSPQFAPLWAKYGIESES